ncbi:MAG: S-layer homology domain-containing protein [Clostridiales Family XIII bacterium]|jgi:hypothetical protein|nr:S-layer homology domain-containing protein [Clostridiales Family XIII bacterium]
MKGKAITFIFASVLGLAIGVFAVSPAFAANPSDTAGHWAEGQILAGISYGYINGYPDGSFKPEGTITRAEFVTIINKARNYTAMTNIPFRDVPVNEWYFQEVQRAYSAGYIQGDSENNFNPNAQITRQEAAVILDRIAPGGDTTYALTGVRDADKIDAWALSAVKAVYSRAYITGDAEGNFNPQSSLKRGEAVTIVNRVLGISPLTPGTALTALSITNISVTGISADSATLSLTATRDGNVYWVVLTGSGASTPTAEQILAGLTADNRSAYGSGSRSIYANSAITAALSSLQQEQSYKVCAAARDAAGNFSPVAVYTFATSAAGGAGEEWLGSNFTVSSIDNNAFTLTVNSSRSGTLYYVIVEDPNRTVKTPPQDYIRNGRNADNSSSGVISGNFAVSSGVSKPLDITGLKSGTNYKIFGCVYESSSTSSLYSTVKSSTFTTTGSYVDWITDFSVSSIGATGATLNVRTNNAGTFCYVVTESSVQPRAARIRDGYDYNNYLGTARGSVNVSANVYTYPVLTNLTANRHYYVFALLYVNGSLSEVETRSFTTTGTGATPLLGATYTLSTTATPGAIAFSNSGFSYAATAAINISATENSGATVTITVTKPSSAVTVTALLNSAAVASTDGVTFYLSSDKLNKGRNTFTLTVAESNKSSLTYTIYIDK